MAGIDTVPNLPAYSTTLEKEDTSSSYDEKTPAAEKVNIDEDDLDVAVIGDVYADGPRIIDLGENGKERPIGTESLFLLLIY